MSTWRMALFAAIVANVLGWVLPAVYNEAGWRAFRAALSPLWPYEGFKLDPGLLLVLSVASALTNALFAVLVLVLVLREERARVVLWLAAAATLLNLHWPLSMGAERRLLEAGYFVWAASFALLALAALLVVRAHRHRNSVRPLI
jgi:hypothetical protein